MSEERLALFDEATPLFGALPELDSMAVAGLLTELEDRLGIIIDDDDVDGDIFETLGSLIRFAKDKALGRSASTVFPATANNMCIGDVIITSRYCSYRPFSRQ